MAAAQASVHNLIALVRTVHHIDRCHESAAVCAPVARKDIQVHGI
jgi:hypothetical protein